MSINGSSINPPLTAKNGHTLEVIIVGRVSDPGPGKQSIESLHDQESMHLEWLRVNAQDEAKRCNIAASWRPKLFNISHEFRNAKML